MNPTIWQSMGRKKNGSVLVMVCVFLVALFAFAALSIDVSNVFHQQRNVQSGTDAAALSAVLYLTNTTWTAADIKSHAIDEAKLIAAANGVTVAEIAASSNGTVQVGQWDFTTSTFTADATPYNAVLVPARRNVTMNFGQIVGMTQMSPAVISVASLGGTGGAVAIPFGIGQSLLIGKDFNANSSLVIDGTQAAGNWGKIDVDGYTVNGSKKFEDAVTQAAAGNGDTVSVGESVPNQPGVAGLEKGLQSLINQIVVFPITTDFGNGAGNVTITGFVLALVVDVTNGGNNSVITLKLVSGLTGDQGGGPSGGVYAQIPVLVQ